MSSLLTNTSAMTALATLRNINRDMDTTTNRISTGQRVTSAADNAAYWSIATGMKNQNETNSAVLDALGMSAAIVDSTATALTQAIDLAKKIQAKYTTATNGGVDQTTINNDVTELKNQIKDIFERATFNGVNLVKASSSSSLTVVLGYTSGTGGSGTVGTMVISAMGTNLATYLGSATSAATTEQFIQELQKAAADLGVKNTRIGSQKAFIKALSEATERGISQLIDANMEEESARLKALQTQQQLGVQALSIANGNASNILQLFRG